MYDYKISACRSTLESLDKVQAKVPTKDNASGQKGLSVGMHDNSASVAAAAKNDTKLPDKQHPILNVASPCKDTETPNDGGDDTDTESLVPTEPASDREEPEEEELLQRIPTATSTDDLAAMKVRFTGSTKSLDAPPSRHKHVKGARKHPPRKTIDQVHTTGSGSSGALASASKMGFHYNYAPFDPAVGAVRIPLAPMVPSYSTPVAGHADGAKTADAFAHINHGSRHSIAGAISSVLGVGFHPAGLAVAPPRLPNAPMVSSSTLDSGYTAKENATARIGRTNPGLCAPKRAREDSAGDEEPAPKRKCLQRTYAFVFTGPATTPEEPECSVPSGSK